MHELARGQREHRRPDRPEIGLRVDLVALGHGVLGRHEGGRAEHHARLGGVRVRHVAQPGDAEVEHLERAPRREHQVAGLDVPVNEPAGVRGREHVEELKSDAGDERQGQPPALALPDGLDRLPLEQLHDEEGPAVVGDVVVEHGDRARMVHPVGEVPLAQEPGARVGAPRQVGVQHLDRKLFSVAMSGRVHGRHAADPENAVERVLALQERAHARGGAFDQVLKVSSRHSKKDPRLVSCPVRAGR